MVSPVGPQSFLVVVMLVTCLMWRHEVQKAVESVSSEKRLKHDQDFSFEPIYHCFSLG